MSSSSSSFLVLDLGSDFVEDEDNDEHEADSPDRESTYSAPHRKQRSVAGKPAYVLRAFERAGVRTILLTHDAFDFV